MSASNCPAWVKSYIWTASCRISDHAPENSVAELYDTVVRAKLVGFSVVKTASKTEEIT